MSQTNFAGISFGYDADKIFKERDEKMCSRWKCSNVQYTDCSLDINYNATGNYIVNGKSNSPNAVFVKYWAAAPPTYSLSFSGSGLPYPNEEVAHEKTPNQGVAKIQNGQFQFALEYPNSYYDNMQKVYVEPHVKFVFCDSKGQNIGDVHIGKLGNGIPFRSLTWPMKRDWNVGPLFYCNNNLPVRNQEQILRDSGYPAVNKEPGNFWGKMPPH
jgi:hypothetical protein